MKSSEKKDIRIDISSRATIAALEVFGKNNPGASITKGKLFRNVVSVPIGS